MTNPMALRRAVLDFMRTARLATIHEIEIGVNVPKHSLRYIFSEMIATGQLRKYRRGVYAIGHHLSSKEPT